MRRNLLLVATQETTVTKTLILLFHPDLKRSKANAALAGAAAKLDGVEVADMQAAYPDSMDMFRDGEREARRLLAADRIVLQFPIQWYSTPPLMKAWQDAVLTRMFYVTYETEGRALEGTPLMLAATAGNVPESYRPGGRNMFTMEALLAPLRATAHRCGLSCTAPFIIYQADKLEAEELEAAASNYAATLKNWIAGPLVTRQEAV
ncbi:flavodoxin family protein [Sinorhizobium meliloti]|uniref:NAD(P)H dehydrogenase n=1 Tax=Sinorhizobium meliloti (strain SM11) TaxID=707241 RepID=F7XCP4_SINMM|nr:NAD(P)H-dependent oxidoreductase [Sinorhizobium meliloti]AEG58008.1 NAD(P)H dehydrogenase (quinone) [Sinorhizobium meliloti AK83]AEH81454.1 NAD(P)H dehydrogenase [Sinorhizobium meliloti SM11]ARS67046.1 NAD(P)H dehydrogenase [Sinorhizobium meliloti RU11/001]CCM69884.1 NAD(P)H dehydrogenase (quinone) [Sinorhizobium meliloti Rm41]AIM01389.1 NAD(P)H dehydrogenase [Sinorhizobium meliloti]